MVTQQRLLELFDYDELTGDFTSKRLGRKVGKTANNNYFVIKVDGKWRRAHRMAWLYIHGYEPVEIDHINGNKLDNSLGNLRSVTHAENMRNLPVRHGSKSKATGVVFTKESWEARIQINGIQKYLGRFKNLFDAVAARKSAENKYGFSSP